MIWLVVLLGCGKDVQPDPGLDANDPEVPLDVALERCARAGARAGACGFDALQTHGAMDAEGCARLAPGTWRGECWFLVAERSTGPLDERYALCARAGPFHHDCDFHIWQAPIVDLFARGESDPWEEAHDILAEHARYNPHTDGRGSFSEDFWERFWGEWWKHQPDMGASHCGALDGEARDACRDRRLASTAWLAPHHPTHIEAVRAAVCGEEVDGSETLTPRGPRIGDDPAVQAVARAAVCGDRQLR